MFSKGKFAILLSVLLFLSLACSKLETADSYYPDYSYLGKSGEPGNWIPTFIPPAAAEIRERHKIDTGAELLMFRFGKDSSLSLGDACKKIMANDVKLPPAGFLGVTWWPDSLFHERAKKADMERYEFYHCEREAFLAVKQVDGVFQAFYWRISLN